MTIEVGTTHITPVGGNVFEDLGFDPIEAKKLKMKSEMMIQLSQWIRENNLKPADAAKILKVTRPRVSDVMRGKINKLTIDALIDMLELTGHHVTISIV
jgi:predicted XRE-type DNA-binding protein